MSERKNYIFFYLFLLWLGHLVNVYFWLKLDVNYLTYDAHRHFLMSLKIFDAYQNPSRTLLSNFVEATQLHPYPPLVGILTAPFYFLFGVAQDTGVMLNSAIFLAILIFSIYKIGEKLLNKSAGLLSAFLITMYPVVFNQLKVYMSDVPLAAFVTLSVYLLIMADNFNNLKYSTLFGISCGLGMLVKYAFPIFIIGPLGYIIIKNIFYSKSLKIDNPKKWITNLALSLSLGFFICFPYYLEKIDTVLGKISNRWIDTWPTPVPELGQFLHILRAFFWYFWGFINWQISFFYFLIFIIGILFYYRTASKNKSLISMWLLSSWILVSYFRYVIGFNMEVTGVRYTIPLLPAVALITAAGLMQIPIKKIKIFSITTAVIFGIFQLLFISYPILNNRFSKEIAIPIHLSEKIKKYRMLPESILVLSLRPWAVSGRDCGSHPIDAQDYLIANEEIFRIIDSSRSGKKEISIFIIPDDTRLWYLQYKSYIEKKPFRIFCDWCYLSLNMRDSEEIFIRNLVRTSDYIIDKGGGWQGEPYVQYLVTKARDYFNQNKDEFMLLAKVRWPDNSGILIFKRRGFKN